MVEEGGEGVEEADVDPEWEREHPELGRDRELVEAGADAKRGVVGDGGSGGWSWWACWDEERGDAGYARDDADVEHHVRDIRGFCGPEWIDELAQRATEWVGEGGDGGGADATFLTEPGVAVVGWRGEDEGLG